MPVFKDKKRGTWFVSKKYQDPLTRKKKTYFKRGFKTKKDAVKDEHIFILNLQCVQTSNYKMNEIIDMYLEYKKLRIKPRSYYDIKKIIDKHILMYFEEFTLKDMSVPVIEFWQKGLLSSGYSNSYLESIQGQMSSIFRYCISKSLIETNPIQILGYVKNRDEPKKQMSFYTHSQYVKFKSMILEIDKDYKLVFDLLYFTGMRIGELQARTWKDINFDTGLLYIHTNYDCKNRIIVNRTKNGEVRSLYLNENLLKQLKERYLEMKEYTNFSDDWFIIGDIKVLSKKAIENRKNKYIKTWNELHPDDQIPYVRIHDFRHSHVSLLLNAGIDSLTISERLGHSKQMVENVYGHLFPNKKKAVLDVLNNL